MVGKLYYKNGKLKEVFKTERRNIRWKLRIKKSNVSTGNGKCARESKDYFLIFIFFKKKFGLQLPDKME